MLEKLQHPANNNPGYATTRPWISQKQLINVFEVDGLQSIMNPIVDGPSVYLFGGIGHGPGEPISAQLLRVPLAGGPVQRLGMLPTTAGHTLLGSPEVRLTNTSVLAVSACLAEGKYCVATRDQGIMIFPTDGSPALQLMRSVACPQCGDNASRCSMGTVYAGLGKEGSEGYLVILQPGPTPPGRAGIQRTARPQIAAR